MKRRPIVEADDAVLNIERRTIRGCITEEHLFSLFNKHMTSNSTQANAFATAESTERQKEANAGSERRRRVQAVADGLDKKALVALMGEIHVLADIPEGADRVAAARRWFRELDADGNGTIEWYELRNWWVNGGGNYTVNLGRLAAAAAVTRLRVRSQWMPRTPPRPPRFPGVYYSGRLHRPLKDAWVPAWSDSRPASTAPDEAAGDIARRAAPTPEQLFSKEMLARRPWGAPGVNMRKHAPTRPRSRTSTAEARRESPTRVWHAPVGVASPPLTAPPPTGFSLILRL